VRDVLVLQVFPKKEEEVAEFATLYNVNRLKCNMVSGAILMWHGPYLIIGDDEIHQQFQELILREGCAGSARTARLVTDYAQGIFPHFWKHNCPPICFA
jgi:hypothetical protein